MRPVRAVSLLLAISAMAVSAAEPTPAAAPEPIKISDTEAVVIDKTIRGFAQSKRDRIEVFDRKKGKTVALRLDRIVADDPACVKFPKEGFVAICGECTEQVTVKTEKDEKVTDGDKYVIWFVVQRGTLALAVVREMFIKSVNGKVMYEWTQVAEGQWSATVVPDPAP